MQRTVNAKLRIAARYADLLVLVLSYVLLLLLRSAIVAVWPFDLIPGEGRILRETALIPNLNLLILFIPAWLLGLQVSGSYKDIVRVKDNLLFLRICWASIIGAGASLAILFALKQSSHVSRTLFFGFMLMSAFTVFLGRRYLVRFLKRRYARGVDTHNILVVTSNGSEIPLLGMLEKYADRGIRLIGVVTDETGASQGYPPVLGRIEDLHRILEEHPVDQVYATGRTWNVESMRWIADSCEEVGVEFSLDANFLGLKTARADLEDLDGNAILSFSTTPRNGEALVMKRIIDIVGAAAALVMLSPVFLITALAIKLEDREGPVFYGQRRSGLNGRIFTMWKFRSMVADAENLQALLSDQNEVDGPVFKIARDPRVTRVGRLIRKLSIDEFPQFWNVLVGEMSLVGPRPPIPSEVKKYERWQMRRLSMKPGMTCLWQVGGRNDIDFNTWMEMDLEYIDNWSLFLDLKLLAKTPKAVLTGTGK